MNLNESIFSSGKEVDLSTMLEAREQRAHLQQAFLSELMYKDNGSLLVMTMAIPGPIKSNEPLNQAFDYMVDYIQSIIKTATIVKTFKREEHTGYEYYVVSTLSPREMKEFAVEVEESHPLGRLFDIDVLKLNEDGLIEGTSRTQLGLPVRTCFICDQPAKECGRSRRHSVEELQAELSKQILRFLNN